VCCTGDHHKVTLTDVFCTKHNSSYTKTADKVKLDDIIFIMSDLLNDIIEVFLSNLAALPPGEESYAEIDKIIAPALAGEQLLRTLLATNHPSIPSDPHVGLVNIFSIWPRPTTIGRDRAADFNSRHLFPFLDSEIHSLRLPDGRPAIVPRAEFLKNWDIFTNGALKDLDWKNVVAAGGAVLACLKSTARQDWTNIQRMNLYQSDIYSGSDIDLFLYGLSPSEVSFHVISLINPVLESCTDFTILRPWTSCKPSKIKSMPPPYSRPSA
jgi:hypothetical protein